MIDEDEDDNDGDGRHVSANNFIAIWWPLVCDDDDDDDAIDDNKHRRIVQVPSQTFVNPVEAAIV